MSDTTTVGQRLKEMMRENSLSEYELSKISGVPQPSINRIVNDRVKSPKYENVEKLSRALRVSASYIMYGESDKKDGNDQRGEEDFLESAIGLDEGRGELNENEYGGGVVYSKSVKSNLISMFKDVLGKDSYVPHENIYPEIYWSDVKRFSGQNVLPSFRGYKNYCSDFKVKGRGFWLTINGDAMASINGQSPTLPEGTRVLFDTGEEIKAGMVVLAFVSYKNSMVCRTLVDEGEGDLFLKPLNPSYPVIPLANDVTLVASALEARFSLLND